MARFNPAEPKNKKKEEKDDKVEKKSKRTLLPALEALAPALKRVLSPERQNIWFDKQFAFAAGAHLGVRVPFKSHYHFGVPGAVLLKLLQSESVDPALRNDDHTLVLSYGRSYTELAIAPLERKRVWKFPDAPPKGSVGWVITKELLEAFKRVADIRTSGDELLVLQRGVVALPNKEGWDLYSTDQTSLATTFVAMELPKNSPAMIFPHEFLEVVIAQGKPGNKLFAFDNCFAVYGEQASIFVGQLEASEDKLREIAGPVTRFLGATKKQVPIPASLKVVLSRAKILAGDSKKEEDNIISLRIKNDELVVSGRYGYGRMEEIMPCSLPPAVAWFNIDRLARALNYQVNEMALIDKTGIVLFGGENTVIILASLREKPGGSTADAV